MVHCMSLEDTMRSVSLRERGNISSRCRLGQSSHPQESPARELTLLRRQMALVVPCSSPAAITMTTSTSIQPTFLASPSRLFRDFTQLWILSLLADIAC